MPRTAWRAWRPGSNNRPGHRRAPRRWRSAAPGCRFAGASREPRSRGPPARPAAEPKAWRDRASRFGRLDEVEQLTTQPQELGMFAGGELIARARQVDRQLDADPPGMRQQTDEAVA